VGARTWFQGNTTLFGPQATTGYLGVNYESGAAASTISNWQISPPVLLQNGASLTFFTRTVDLPTYPDRLQVRLNQTTSTNVGTGPTDVGDFTTLLLDINPSYIPTAYPNVWTQYVVTLAGLPAAGVTGRFAFRYFVENAGVSGVNSDYIGIDEAVYPSTVGVCCRVDETCFLSTSTNCATVNGIYRGDGTVCASTDCFFPSGACCLPDGTCTVMLSAQCTVSGGTFGGSGVTCAAAACGPACYSVGLNVSIPDGGNPTNGIAGADAAGQLFIPDHGTINNLVAKVYATHTWQGDVRIRLVHPDGTSVDLINRPGVAPPKQGASTNYGFSTGNFGTASTPMLFRDSATTVYDDATGFPGPPPGTAVATDDVTGVWKAESGPLAVFNGKDSFGVWQVIANDYAAGDVGTLRSLAICVSTTPRCYANCDSSTIAPCLNVLDFTCFLNKFAAGDLGANCDGSTTSPVLNVLDFTCFLNAFAAGCSSC
jgi:subtilisin-like proprotein convertase family protein